MNPHRARRALLLAAAALLGGPFLHEGPSVAPARASVERADRDESTTRPAWERTPGVAATFLRDSYRPGDTATLVLWDAERRFSLRFFRVGATANVSEMRSNTFLQGTPVSELLRFGPTGAHRPVTLHIGAWPSGLYFARLWSGGRFGFATFVVRPRTLGRHHVLIVMPTYTWQAYNFRDDNHDGIGDTWYADARRTSVDLVRPFLARGVPPHFKNYDLPFLDWMAETGKAVDFISDTDLDTAGLTPTALARAYHLVVFSGHHEYVTQREYDTVTGYRDLGGHLMFLSANNFFRKVVRTGNMLTIVGRWRDRGRPEAELVGVQYLRNDGGAHQGPYTVVNTTRWPWLFAGTGLTAGSTFGSGGIEIDHTTVASPRSITVVAAIPNLMGQGFTAQMTYYETPRGAKVFAAGAFTLGGARDPVSCHILQNLWDHLAASPGGRCVGRSSTSRRNCAHVGPSSRRPAGSAAGRGVPCPGRSPATAPP